MLSQKQKEHRIQVCQHLLNQYDAEGVSFLHCIIIIDEIWCYHYEPETKHQSTKVVTREFYTEEKVQETALSG